MGMEHIKFSCCVCCGREVPAELIREARGSEVHLNMEDHRHEEYVSLKTKVKAFSGKGHVLGRYDIN